jgi:hypothetical protein
VNVLDKSDVFVLELSIIKDDGIREWTKKAIETLPDYFFVVPASSTGKYHPDYALGEGGLVRHSKAAVRIARELFNINSFLDEEKDIIISGLNLHDGLKHGLIEERYSRHDHPILMRNHLMCQTFFNDIPQATVIADAIASHMGQWNKNQFSSAILPLPETKIQRFVHMCDYLASRKCLEFNFDVAG